MGFLLALCTLLAGAAVTEGIIKVNPSTQMMVDELGRTRIFHGVNAVYKVFPWHPDTTGFDPDNSLSDIDAANLQMWGFNAVRLGVMWPGVEPERGTYSMTYIQVIQNITQTLWQHGIVTLLDFHQDVWSRKFCGEGAPDWAVINDQFTLPFALPVADVMPVDSNQYPNLDQCLERIFAEYYFTETVSDAFQNFYDNVDDILTQDFAGFWSLLSSTFNGSESILGYELINEPWAGDIFDNPDLLVPGIPDKENLSPMYSMLNTVIRQNDDDHMIFFEKSLTDIVGPCGFSDGPGGAAYNDRQVYSYHVYCAPDDTSGNPKNLLECEVGNTLAFEQLVNDVANLGCGGMMTEFGAVGNKSTSAEDLGFVTGLADSTLSGWMYWQFKLFQDLTTQGSGEGFYQNGVLEEPKVKALSRTYAQAISGVPTHVQFDPWTSKFELVYVMNTNIDAPTVIYLNEGWYYPNGFDVNLTPSSYANWTSPSNNTIFITANSGTANGVTLTVEITAI